ncbi:MAG: hypothetical protein M3291_00885 [Actinomycetota bacterium]|nr:hypothetical protein [Actinomycetota bacterium]
MKVPSLKTNRNPGLRRTVASAAALLSMIAVPGAPASAQVPAGTSWAGSSWTGSSWTPDLAPDADDTGVSATDGELRLDPATAVREVSTGSPRLQGMLLTAQHELADPTTRVAADLVVDLPPGTEVLVDVRGQRADGGWTEWIPAAPGAPAELEAPGRTVQARLMLLAGDAGASPVVRSLHLTADLAAGLLVGPSARVADTFRVFATREGLVGGTTANGHVIRPHDHFVALPSRRGLAPRDTGDYTVKVCADNGRCEWAPVWDVGPWNVTDDHWNPPERRESWRDLATGLPQAQAAFVDGYNGGRDQFGRQVGNPAGIDLGDGTFLDGLGLEDNSWVTASYLWTDSGPTAVVRAPLLDVRDGPSTASTAVGLAAEHARVVVECVAVGEPVSGSQGVSERWLRLGPGQFVSAASVSVGPDVSPC